MLHAVTFGSPPMFQTVKSIPLYWKYCELKPMVGLVGRAVSASPSPCWSLSSTVVLPAPGGPTTRMQDAFAGPSTREIAPPMVWGLERSARLYTFALGSPAIHPLFQ